MVYVLVELRNYRQLARLRSDRLPALESGLRGALGAHAATAENLGQGILAATLGAEEDLEVAAAAATASRVRDYLASRREEIFGYTVILAGVPSGTLPARAARLL
ncbi:MAG TPA: hypothetical protein VHE79_01375, partial [Spirochaetia bacterium]